jgi:hypothetical protein
MKNAKTYFTSSATASLTTAEKAEMGAEIRKQAIAQGAQASQIDAMSDEALIALSTSTSCDEEEEVEEEDGFYEAIEAKSKARREAKANKYSVAAKFPRPEGTVLGERAIGHQIMKNRGLVAHKAKINRNPRVKKREQYRKAKIRIKGSQREVRTGETEKYGGETTGIKSNISRSRRLA